MAREPVNAVEKIPINIHRRRPLFHIPSPHGRLIAWDFYENQLIGMRFAAQEQVRLDSRTISRCKAYIEGMWAARFAGVIRKVCS